MKGRQLKPLSSSALLVEARALQVLFYTELWQYDASLVLN